MIHRSRLNAKINRNFEVFTATDFLGAITQHIPDKGAQMVRYDGWYSNKMRGVRLKPSAFSRQFKRTTGKCFMQVVNELRLAQVCRLLVETDRTVAEIAYGCGFATLSHFNSQFQRSMKMVPRKYRALHGSIRCTVQKLQR